MRRPQIAPKNNLWVVGLPSPEALRVSRYGFSHLKERIALKAYFERVSWGYMWDSGASLRLFPELPEWQFLGISGCTWCPQKVHLKRRSLREAILSDWTHPCFYFSK